MLRPSRVIIAASIAAALCTGAGVFLALNESGQPASAGMPARATATYPDGATTSNFTNIGDLVATADFTFEGEVVRVEQGEPTRIPDGTGDEIVPRILVVEVRELFHSRGAKSGAPTTLRVTDGYWQNGVGHERESTGWATPGQVGFFLVGRDRAPDGTLMSTYSPLTGNGIALLAGDQVKYAHGGVWQALGDSATPAEFRGALKRGAAAAQSGAASPVPVTVCYPSVPGDENSEPICVEG